MPDGTKSFEFASRKNSSKVIETFEIDGEKFGIRPLKDSSVAYLVHKTRSGDANDIISAVLDFTEKALVPESAKRFEALVLDPDAGLTVAQIVEVFQYVLGVVSAFPTGSPPASSSARRRTGSGSKAISRGKVALVP